MIKPILLTAVLFGVALSQHDGHQHADNSTRDCSCTTGWETSDLTCSDSSISAVESYIANNDCDPTGYCMVHHMGDMGHHLMYTGSDDEDDFACFQAYSLLVQYHDYCLSGSVDEIAMERCLVRD